MSYLGEGSDLQNYNLYIYCENNPVIYCDPSGHAIDTVLDIAFAIWSLVDFVKNPSWENFGWFALDAVCAVIPFVTAGGKILKGASRLDGSYDFFQYTQNLGKIADSSKVAVIGRKMERVEDATDLYKAISYSGYEPYRLFNAVNQNVRAPLRVRIAAKMDNFIWLGDKLLKGYDIIDIGLGGYNITSSIVLEQSMLFFWKYGTNIFAFTRKMLGCFN